MPTIYSYQKHIDNVITRELALPVDATGQRLGTELATIGGITYISLPDGATLPTAQPSEIAASIKPVTLDAATHDAVVAASPHCKLIAQRMQAQIRAQYSADDEMFFARISIGALMSQYTMGTGEAAEVAAYGTFVEGVRAWGRAQRAALGL